MATVILLAIYILIFFIVPNMHVCMAAGQYLAF